MEYTTSSTVFTADRPWVHFRGNKDLENLAGMTPSHSGLRVVALDGADMVDVDGVFEQYYREFEFPTYFGGNWPAFEECLTSLGGLPGRGYLTLVHNAELVLSGDRGDLRTFSRILGNTGRYWSNALGVRRARGGGPVPFNTVFLSKNYVEAELSLLLDQE